MLEAYSHEVSSAGFWPGGSDEGTFYSYAYPEPPGLRRLGATCPPAPSTAPSWASSCCPYAAVRTADDPDALLGDFLQRTYVAAAELAGWDRAALEHG